MDTKPFMNPKPSREEVLFEAALEFALPAERDAFLRKRCGEDDALRERVLALLAADGAAGNFMAATPALTPGPTLKIGRTTLPATVTEQAGDCLGPYKLREKIGEGGCGVVYVADQEKPVRRRVALKVIKLGMDSQSVIARFEAERQALAMMDHPNIAKVLDAGTTDQGRPYFVMELVRGIRITDYCDQNKLSTRARVELFIQVCQAVQHAHQKGIIHRDLKPSNILVTLHDGVPIPKVIDFGIAKATEGRLTDKTIYTELHQFIGTPAYMSPEQAEMSGLDIDTRSDIYSLGVLLYELLTGKTPFDARELQEAGFDQMRRTIREREPARPSTRLSTMLKGELTATAGRHGADAPRLVHLVRGDLDWIVMKALEKDRTRRYETANGLAADLKRHLDNEPVLARPPSAAYKLQKAFRRNKLAFAAAGGVVAALVFGLSLATWMYFKQRAAYREADLAMEAAQAEAKRTSDVARFLKDMLEGIGPSKALGRDTQMLREILDKTAERLGTDLQGQPEVEISLRDTLGTVYNELGEAALAERMLRAALSQIPNCTRWPEPQQREYQAYLQDRLASALLSQRRFSEAEQLYQESLQTFRTLFGPGHVRVAQSLENLGCVFQQQGRLAAAESNFRAALELLDRLPAARESSRGWLLLNLAKVIGFQGRHAESEPLNRRALDSILRTAGTNSLKAANARNSLGSLLLDLGKLPEAEVHLREALRTYRQLRLVAHEDVSRTTHNLARLLARTGRAVEITSLYQETLAQQRQAGGSRHPAVAMTLQDYGGFLSEGQRFAEAEPLLQEALSLTRDVYGPDNVETAAILGELGLLYVRWDRPTNAEPVLREGITLCRKLGSAGNEWLVPCLLNLGNVLHSRKRLEEAEAAYREGLDVARRLYHRAHERTALALENVGIVLTERRAFPEAEATLTEALDMARALPDTNRIIAVLGRLGYLANERKDFPGAEKHYRASLDWASRAGTPPSESVPRWIGLGRALEGQRRLAEAEATYREAVDLTTRQATAGERASGQPALEKLFDLLTGQRRWAEAEPVASQSLRLAREAPSSTPGRLEEALQDLASTLYRQGKLAEAEGVYREKLASQRQRHSETNAGVLGTMASLGRCLAERALADPTATQALAHAREAEQLLQQVVTVREGITNMSRGELGDARSRFGGARLAVALSDPTLAPDARLVRLAEVESRLLSGLDLMTQSSRSDPDHRRDGQTRLVRLYEFWERLAPNTGKAALAAAWRQKLNAFEQAESARSSPPE